MSKDWGLEWLALTCLAFIAIRATGQARGFAFVEMSDAEGARKAIVEPDQHQYGGRSVTVNEAKPMQPRGGSDGGRQRNESRW